MLRQAPPLLVLLSIACAPEARYQHAVDAVRSPGAQLAVVDAAGESWSGSSGEAAPGVPVTGQHAFLIGSNTKVLTAAVVLQLVDEGKLALDDRAATWVPQLDPAITVRDLLGHTSGLGEYFEHEVMTADDGAAKADPWTPQALIDLGMEVRDDGPQATAVYSNTNYVAVGLVIEAIEGRPYGEVLEARLFGPLGMERSRLLASGEDAPDHVAWGDGGAWGEVSWFDPSVGWAAGSGYADASDLARFYEAMLSGELYAQDLVDAQLEPVEADLGFEIEGGATYYGLGVMVVDVGGQRFVGHRGGTAGATSLVLEDPETGAITALVTNGSMVDVLGPSMRALRVAAKP